MMVSTSSRSFPEQVMLIVLVGGAQSAIVSFAVYFWLEAYVCISLMGGTCSPDGTRFERIAAVAFVLLAIGNTPVPLRISEMSWLAAAGYGLLLYPLTLLSFWLLWVLGFSAGSAIAAGLAVAWIGIPILVAHRIRS
jgi:hypothetical protein